MSATAEAEPVKVRLRQVTPEAADTAVDMLAVGMSIRSVARRLGVAKSSLARALLHDDRSGRYARAMVERAAFFADKACTLADRVARGKLDANAGRVAIDTYKWAAGKADPGRWGDRLQVDQRSVNVTVQADLGAMLADPRIAERVADLAGLLAERTSEATPTDTPAAPALPAAPAGEDDPPP